MTLISAMWFGTFITAGGVMNEALNRGKTDALSQAEANSKLVTNIIRGGGEISSHLKVVESVIPGLPRNTATNLQILFWFSFQNNLRFVNDESKQFQLRWLPAFRSFADDGKGPAEPENIILNLHNGDSFLDRVFMISTLRNKSPYAFEKGDSGTGVSWLVFPFGALSTVNWEPAEGVSITPLPKPSEKEDDGAYVGTAAGAMNNGSGDTGSSASRSGAVASRDGKNSAATAGSGKVDNRGGQNSAQSPARSPEVCN